MNCRPIIMFKHIKLKMLSSSAWTAIIKMSNKAWNVTGHVQEKEDEASDSFDLVEEQLILGRAVYASTSSVVLFSLPRRNPWGFAPMCVIKIIVRLSWILNL